MTQLGTVLVFKQGVSKAEAVEALKKIQSVLADDYHGRYDAKAGKFVSSALPPVNEFNPEHGGPVWYVP